MAATAHDLRQERGLALAKAKPRGFRRISDNVLFVPSQTSAGSGYVVDVAAGKCSCADHETRGDACKHLWAARYFRHDVAIPDGSAAVPEALRISYPQDWPAYNRAQCEEKERVQLLLADLCKGVVEPPRTKGRPRMPLRDVVFGAVMKVYGTQSGRRSTTDLRACKATGLVGRAAAYNTIFKYMEQPELLPVLTRLVDETAKPLAAVESKFAVDGTGFATQTYVRWFDYKHGEDRRGGRPVGC